MRAWRDQARDDARAILQAALAAVNPQPLMRRIVRHDGALHLPDGKRVRIDGRAVRVLALGKAAGAMSAHAQPWGPLAEVVVSAPYAVDLPGFESYVGGHPLPDEESLRAGERALRLAEATGPEDLLVLLLSGGASAMAESSDVPLADLRRVNEALLRSGAGIAEVNTVRRHLSRLKGGGLARACRGETLVLAISDVDDITALGSGPACADPTTFTEALHVLDDHGLLDGAPATVREHLELGAQGLRPETLKPGAPELARVHTLVLADNATALEAAARAAQTLGYAARLLPGALHGEARERGRELGMMARSLADERGPVALLAGGETTVHLVGHGRGGRNQELALAAVDALSGQDALLAAFGTDGVDGPTDAAGAIVDGLTRARADAAGLDGAAALAENDSHAYFDALDDLIRTGVTGTNVRDLVVVLVRGRGGGPRGISSDGEGRAAGPGMEGGSPAAMISKTLGKPPKSPF